MRHGYALRSPGLWLTLIGALWLVLPAVRASTILQVDLDQLLAQAELVFEGQVTGSHSFAKNNRGAVHTTLVFKVDEVIAGTYNQASIELEFAGGIVEGRGMRVAGSVIPKPGERGIYFVESVSAGLANPLLGWSQGHFLLQRDAAGVDRVLTNSGQPIASVSTAPQAPDTLLPFSNGVARGVGLAARGRGIDTAISASQFKAALRQHRRFLPEVRATGNADANAAANMPGHVPANVSESASESVSESAATN